MMLASSHQSILLTAWVRMRASVLPTESCASRCLAMCANDVASDSTSDSSDEAFTPRPWFERVPAPTLAEPREPGPAENSSPRGRGRLGRRTARTAQAWISPAWCTPRPDRPAASSGRSTSSSS